jgi:hypothetical protein
MTNIIERLRSPEVFLSTSGMVSPVAHQAASEIERLLAENALLREALQHAEAAMEGMASDQLTAVETANLWNATMESIRAALEGKP